MNLKVDAFDKKILGILLSNSKESTTSIGRKIRLGRENVDYKIKRLINLGIIKEFITVFDEHTLHIRHHVLFAQLTRLTKEREQDILQHLKAHPYISWIGTAAGKWTLICDIYVPDHASLGEIIDKLTAEFGDNIEEYMLLELVHGEYFFEKFLGKERKISLIRTSKKPISLDELDYNIMSKLNADARITYAELSGSLKMSANGIKRRIKDLEHARVIKKYSITLDFKKFDYDWYGIQAKAIKFDAQTTKKLSEYLRTHAGVIFFYKYIGAWDYDIGYLAKTSAELREFINELRANFPDALKITDVFITLDEVKGYHLPHGVFSKVPGRKTSQVWRANQ